MSKWNRRKFPICAGIGYACSPVRIRVIPGDSYVTLSSHEEVSLPFIPLEATVSVLAAPPPNYLPDDGAYLHGTPPWRETWARLTPLLLRFGGILACCNRHTSFRWQRKHILRQCGMLSYHLLFRRYHHGQHETPFPHHVVNGWNGMSGKYGQRNAVQRILHYKILFQKTRAENAVK